METRKLQRLKGGTFTLSLPRSWVEEMTLKRSDDIVIIKDIDGALRVYPAEFSPVSKISNAELTLENFASLKTLGYAIGTFYTQGIKRITICCKNLIPVGQKRKIKLFCSTFSGLDLCEEEAGKLVFEISLDPAAHPLSRLLRRTSVFSLGLQEDAVKSVTQREDKLAEEVLERSKEAVRYYRMTIRQVALASRNRSIRETVGVKNCPECVTFALVARDLNRIIYHSTRIAAHCIRISGKEINKNISEGIANTSGIAYSMQEKAVQAFLEEDFDLAVKTMTQMDKLRKKEEELLAEIAAKERDSDVAFYLRTIATELRRIGGYSVAIGDDCLNRLLVPG